MEKDAQQKILFRDTGFQQGKNSLHILESENSLAHSQLPATYPYPEPAQSSPYPD